MKINPNIKIIYSDKKDRWYIDYGNGKRSAGHIYKESCKQCGEPYYMRCDKPTEFCCKGCCQTGDGNHMFGNTHTYEVKEGLRLSVLRSMDTVKQRYGVENMSQIPHIKEKKGQIVVSFNTVKPLVEKTGKKLLSFNGDNKHTMMTLECENGHQYEMRYHAWKRGHECTECFYERLRKQGICDLEGFKLYQKLVYQETQKSYRQYRNNINPLGLKRGKTKDSYQLDHKYSVCQGFRDNIPYKILGSHHNLEMLTMSENTSKCDKCSITKEELESKYYEE